MSIAIDLARIQLAKTNIKTSIEGKGVTVPSSSKIDEYSILIDTIPTGGGSSTSTIVETPGFVPAVFSRLTNKPVVNTQYNWQSDGTFVFLYKYADGKRTSTDGTATTVEYYNPATGSYQANNTALNNQWIANVNDTVPLNTPGFYIDEPSKWAVYSGSVLEAMMIDVREEQP